MDYTVDHVQVAEQHTAVVRGLVPMAGIADFLGGAFGEVMGAVASQGRQVLGPPFGCFDPAPDGFRVEAGFPTDAPVAPQGRVEASTLPGGSALSVLHRGAYDALPGAYRAAQEWAAEHGWTPTGQPWEAYLDEPGVADPRTILYWPAVPAEPAV